MKRFIFFDSETFSTVDIKKAGGFRYVTDESTEMIMGQFAIDDGPVKVYDAYDKSTHHLLEELRQLATDPETVWVFWNAPFDRNILKYTSNIDIPIERTVDAMVIAYSVALPGNLGLCSEAMAIEMPKIDGKDPIHTFCKPAPKNHKVERYTPKEKPDLWKAFIEYGIRDVEALREIFHKLPKDNHRGIERQLWELDTEINERGVRVDLDLVHAALRAIDNEKVRLNARVAELTESVVGAATQREALLKYLNATYGAYMPDMTAATVEGVLADGRLHPEAQELLRIRQQISKASTAKYQTILHAHAPKDHRLRGMLQMNGASRTGRYAGRLVQLQNLPRPKIKGDKVEPALRALKSGNEQSVTDNVMQLCSDLLRSVLVPAPGNKFVCCDLSNIEGRVLPWLAGEGSKLDAFRAYDRGEGEDIYKVTYGKTFGVSPKDVTADQRQMGKAEELAFGFGGGVGAMVNATDMFRIDRQTLVEPVMSAASGHIIERAERSLDWAISHKKLGDLSEEIYLALSVLKHGWREAHENICQFWKDLESAARKVMDKPGTVHPAGRVMFKYGKTKFGAALIMTLPSGRNLYYHKPKWSKKDKEDEDFDDESLSFWNVEQGEWRKTYTYGGSLAENATQATARDVMMHTFPLIESFSYPIVLSVHDEILTEVPDSPAFYPAELSLLMSTNPHWAKGLPLAADGWEGYFYRK